VGLAPTSRLSLVALPKDPAGGSGDFFVELSAAGHRWCALGDVMGHGAPASQHVPFLEAAVRATAPRATSPGVALARLARDTFSYLRNHRTFAALLLVRTPLGTGEGQVGAAGHQPPVLVQRGDRVAAYRLSVRGLLLGGSPGWTYAEVRFPWQRGDVLVLYSDGLVEARTGERPLGEQALFDICCDLAREGPLSADAILAAVRRRYPSLDVRDDVTVVTMTCPC
jgi:serine phosphatase RsbU (regulator of sigma subunit)